MNALHFQDYFSVLIDIHNFLQENSGQNTS